MRRLRTLLILAILASVLIDGIAPSLVLAQTDDPVDRLLSDMSAEAKVGQLFMVTFPGSGVQEGDMITTLIRDYHVGGVFLSPSNDNIINEENTPQQVASLVGALQQTAWEATEPTTQTLPGEDAEPFVPLFIAARHEGNGLPYTAVTNGTTPLPSQMALGATWDPQQAEEVGRVVGQELRALGVNMLLGPSLDVVDQPRPESTGDLGVRSFGGDPFWVGQMGHAYIRGVHEGANDRIAVIAKHFPGLGTADRSLDEEAPTVQRTLEKLRQIDLAPFFSVAQAETESARPDGVLVSHVRFQGLEGGRFVKTRPVSVDSQVLQRLLGLPELATWRQEGGLTVSDGLGLRALQRFYDPTETTFNGRRIAQEAFLAGNDLLLLSQFALTDDWDQQMANATSTIEFFVQRYENDPSFQAVVDAAVRRILRLKLSLHGESFQISMVTPSLNRLDDRVGRSQEVVDPISRQAVTLLSPPTADLAPAPPTQEDDIVIFTDARAIQPCASCQPDPTIDPLVIENTMVRLYGPQTTDQIRPWRVSSFTFSQLAQYLDAVAESPAPTGEANGEEEPTATPEPDSVEVALANAEWIIFGMLNPLDAPPQSNAVRRFLAERADAMRAQQLVVLAYDAPYYLDVTEVSKLSAYYVTYSRIEPAIEASVRLLFGEFVPPGIPSVSVPGINYNLQVQTTPDPDQTISLDYALVEATAEEGTPSATPTQELTLEPSPEGPTPEPKLEVGDQLQLQTDVIVDHNGQPVPDGTPVQFIFTYPQEMHESSQTAATHGGVAETTLTLDRTGQLNVSVQADPVPRATALQITIQEGGAAVIVTITPTPRPTIPSPLPTATPSPEPTVAETPQPPPDIGVQEPRSLQELVGFFDLALATLSLLVASGLGYYVVRLNHGSVEHALRLALWGMVGGLAFYVIYAVGVPGMAWLRERNGVWAAGWVAFCGGVLTLSLVWLVDWVRNQLEIVTEG